MAFNQFDVATGFKTGRDAAKSSGILDVFGASEEERKFQRQLQLETHKANLKGNAQGTSGLDKAKIGYYDSMRKKNKSMSEGTYMSPTMLRDKAKSIKEIHGIIETNKIKREQVASAKESLSRVPTGRIGSFQIGMMKQFDPNNPVLGDWQNLKSVLTDAQLMFTAKTKGAISDREMDLFAQAASNDDLASIPRMRPALDRLERFLEAEENSAISAYTETYGENPFQKGTEIEQSASSGQPPVSQPKDKKSLYNQYRDQGMSPEEARMKAGF